MRAIVQRVARASVTISGEEVSRIDTGLLVLLGIEVGDDDRDVSWIVGKIAAMRIFPDENGKMNRSVSEAGGRVLVVSQFTLHASTKKGNRPSFLKAARPDRSEPLYELFCRAMETELGTEVGRGRFGAEMQVSLVNDGPVTIFIDSKARE